MANVHIVTGGSSGIGLDTAKIFKDGKVIITGRNEEKLIEATEGLKNEGLDAYYKVADVTDKEALNELFEYAKSLGKIKTLVNSAGVSGVGSNMELTFNIDLVGSALILEELLEYAEEDLSVIMISSMMGHTVPANPDYDPILENPLEEGAFKNLEPFLNGSADMAYNFSKKGVQLLVVKYASKFGQKGARINSISPGIIMTPMAEAAYDAHKELMDNMLAMTPANRFGKPEDITNAVEFLAGDKATFITGTDIKVDGGLVNKILGK